MFLPVVLAGGSGSRLWPMSRSQHPKQFLALHSDKTLLQETLARVVCMTSRKPLVICNEDHRFLAAEQLRQVGLSDSKILLEQVGKNTAPAVLFGALHAMSTGEDPLLLILPADHVIQDADAFSKSIEAGTRLAEQGMLVMFGVVPTYAETGYGYIKEGGELAKESFSIDHFAEKPDRVTATKYLESGRYLWNSGIFMFRASTYISEVKKFRPHIFDFCSTAFAARASDLTFERYGVTDAGECTGESIDTAVMENTALGAVVRLDAGWSDIGSWSALSDISEKDENGNVFIGDVVDKGSKNTYVRSQDRLIALSGLENIVVIDTKDALLILNKDDAQSVKCIVEHLRDLGRPEYVQHREVFRPWGKYDSVDSGERYQVKRITVSPGQKLSLQMHHHRAEHWVVVSGTAKVTRNDETFLVSENESTYIELGEVHSLENPGRIPLELIEVQSGSYLGEDDIVRLVDQYGRV